MADTVPDWAQDTPSPQANIPAWAQDNTPVDVKNQSDSQFWHNLGNPEPGYTYGSLLPLKKNNATGEVSLTSVGPVARGIGDLYQSAENQSTETTPDSINAMLALSAVPAAGRFAATKVGERIADKTGLPNFLSTEAGTPIGASPTFNPAAAHSEISGAYGAALKGANPFYDYMNKTAEGKFIDASGMVSPVKKMISDIEADPFHEGRTSLPRLRAFVEQAEANPNMPLSDAVSMKQEINTNFNPKRFNQGSKTPYFEFGNVLDGKLRQAAMDYPEFGVAKKLADKNWVNNVVDPFTGNTELQKFWKPEDYYNQKSVDSGLRDQLPDPTKARAESMLSKISTPVELDAVTRPMSDDTATAFRQAKFNDITNGAGATRLQSAGKTVANIFNVVPIDAAKTALQTISGPQYTRAEIALMKATKLPSPALNPEYAKQLQALKSLQNSSLKLLTWQKPLGYQEIPAASPPSEIMGGNQVSPQIATPSQISSNEAGRQRAANLGMYPINGVGENVAPAHAAASQGQSALLRQYGSAKMMGNENIPPPIYPSGNPNVFSNMAHMQANKEHEARMLADMAKAAPQLDASRQVTPEQVQDIFTNRQQVGNITGNAPQNPAIAEALLAAFKNGGGQ